MHIILAHSFFTIILQIKIFYKVCYVNKEPINFAYFILKILKYRNLQRKKENFAVKCTNY